MIHISIKITTLLLYLGQSFSLYAQPDKGHVTEYLTLDNVIAFVKEHSLESMQAEHDFLSAYWQYREFKAQYLPSMNLNLTLPNFNHSLSFVQNYETGEYNYVQSYLMTSRAQLSIDQNIALTGARISVNTSLERMDQFGQQRLINYINQPIFISISQPLWGTFNALKWSRKIEPKRYEKAKKEYLESLQDVVLQAVDQFFALLLVQKRVEIAGLNLKNSSLQYQFALERNKLKAFSDNELAQIELNMRNDQLDLNEVCFEYEETNVKFNSFLRNEVTVYYTLVEPSELPEIDLKSDWVYETALKNNGEMLKRQIDQLTAMQAVERAKKERGVKADLFVQVGYNRNASRLSESYRNPLDQENISLGIRIPLYDWGVARGRIAVARSQAKITQEQHVQEEIKYQQWVSLKVMEFVSQGERYQIAESTDSVANRLYVQANERLRQGVINVMALTNAQIEKDQAQIKSLTELQNYWQLFYTLEKITLFDFRLNMHKTEQFDQLIKL